MYYENFMKLCDKNGVKPGTVARMTGISTATITAWKQNKYTPKQEKLQKIADYFNVSLDYLLNGTEDDKESEVSENEKTFINLYSQLNEEQKQLIDNLLTSLVSKK